jgi:hypothetical protein
MESYPVTITQQQNKIEFQGVRATYPTGEPVTCYFTLPAQYKPETCDWVGIYPVCFFILFFKISFCLNDLFIIMKIGWLVKLEPLLGQETNQTRKHLDNLPNCLPNHHCWYTIRSSRIRR